MTRNKEIVRNFIRYYMKNHLDTFDSEWAIDIQLQVIAEYEGLIVDWYNLTVKGET